MQKLELKYKPVLAPQVMAERLSNLLPPGPIADNSLERRISRLEHDFSRYAATYPHGLWAPGLAVTNEMRGMTECYLPLAEIRQLFDRFFAGALTFTPFLGASIIHTSVSWLDALQSLQSLVGRANPALLLRRLMADEEERRRFLFFNFLPRQYGGGFGRYPAQTAFLRNWLGKNRGRFNEGLHCLDAACGCGEGTYELALLLLECGFRVEALEVHGSTLEPLELFAAAHGYFPHEPLRQVSYRRYIQPFFQCGAADRVHFRQEDIAGTPAAERYDVVLCNGILGGPFVHERYALEMSIACLAKRVKPGGILLAADRFHDGWKKIAPAALLEEIFAENGFRLLRIKEGVAGVKTERAPLPRRVRRQSPLSGPAHPA